MRAFSVLLSALFLTSCNLAASLTGGAQEFSYTETYLVQGQQHSITAEFIVEDDAVTGLTIMPNAASSTERGHQLAFSANVRRYVLEQNIEEIVLPESIGEEGQLTDVFRGILEELKTDL